MKILKKIRDRYILWKFDRINKKGLSDKEYLIEIGKIRLGYVMNLDNPKTFNEKVNWLKINDHKDYYSILVDKIRVKDYVGKLIGFDHIIETYGVWNSFDEIDFDKLPNKFVLKCNHDSGGLVICKNKNDFDISKARKKINRCLQTNYYDRTKEWPYKNVKPMILAEKLLEDEGKIVPEDFKIYCFNGKPKYIVVFHNRFNKNAKLSETVYNLNWEPQNISLDNHFEVSDEVIPKPECFDELIKCCSILCKDFKHIRIDFYIVNNKVFFGEMTLYTASGFQPMIPQTLDVELGKLFEVL